MLRRMVRSGAVSLFLLVGLVCCSSAAYADVTASIHGSVTDPSGGFIVGATVTLANASTGLHRQTITDSKGYYEFLAVPIGSGYVIEAKSSGFQALHQSGITLTVNQQLLDNLQLTVGAVTQSVEVAGVTTQVETSSTQLGSVLASTEIVSMPLNGRSYTDLLSLQPGVTPVASGSAMIERSPSGDLNPGIMSVNGARENGNAFLVNGGDVNESRDNGTAIIPTLDAIAEYRILTNNYDAEYGKFAGGIINVVTKSGTNDFHGNVFEFLRNDDLDAKNYFNPARGNFKQNQFGGTMGGRILKNRLFFFGDYQGTRQILGLASGSVIVPSVSERSGDFSDVSGLGLPSLTGVVGGDNDPNAFAATLSARLGYTVTPGEPYWFTGCNSTAQCVFPGQAIPQSAWSPAAVGTLQFIPKPNSGSGVPSWTSGVGDQTLRDDKWGTRIDMNRSQNDTLSFYYNFDDANLLSPYTSGNVLGFGGLTLTRSQQANVRDSHTFGPSAVNLLTLNYTRFAFHGGAPEGEGLGNPSDFGFVSGGLGIIPTAPQYAGVPWVSLTGAYSASFGVSSGIGIQADNTFQIADSFTKILGSHTLTFGADLEYLQVNTRQNIQENGMYQFSGEETGNDFADYLIGAPSFFRQASLQLQNVRSKYFSVFGQDNFKVRNDLTINYGLRWEADEPYSDTHGLMMAFIPGEQSVLFPDSPKGWVFPGDPGVPSTISPTRWNNFSPRFGIAYSPSKKDGLLGPLLGGPGQTSIRAGGGIFYTGFEEVITNYELGDAPFGNFYTSPTLIYFEEPFRSRVSANNPGQRFPVSVNIPGAPGPPVSFAPYLPIGTSQVWGTNNVLPYMEQFNLTLQRALPGSMVFTAGYIGSVGRHLIDQRDFNPGNIQDCLHIAQLYTAAGESGGCGPFGEDSIYNIDGQTFDGTRPYSVTSGRYLSQGLLDFSSDPAMLTSANSSYNSLQTSVARQSHSLTFLVGYTYSKSMDDQPGFIGPYENPYDPRQSWALSAFNMKHNFVASYTYALPFQRLTSSQNGLAHFLLAGWQLSGLVRMVTGQPVPITQAGDLSLCNCPGSDVDKPNYLGGAIHFLNPRKSVNSQYFSTDQFVSETLGSPGDSKRDFFPGPGIDDWDMALHRVIPIREGMHLEIRGEFFNVFNHTQFSGVTGNYSSGLFGASTSAADPRIGQVAAKLDF